MASLLALQDPRLLTADEFMQIDFGPNLKAELDNGVIRMMAGGTRDHASVQANILSALRVHLRGTGCRPYGSDMAVRPHGMSIRYPDVTVDRGGPNDSGDDRELSDPRVIIEVLSPSTREADLKIKRAEYKEIAGAETLVFVDVEAETLAISQRHEAGWSDSFLIAQDIALPTLDLTIPHAEIFARD